MRKTSYADDVSEGAKTFDEILEVTDIVLTRLAEFRIAVSLKKSVFAKLKKYNRDNSLKSSGIPTDNKSISKKRDYKF
jgi:hypothetical protein